MGLLFMLAALPAAQAVVTEVPVIDPTDDAGQDPECEYAGSPNEVYFGECYNGRGITSGFRFPGVPVPRGARIDAARIVFSVDGPYNEELRLSITGEASGNALPFSEFGAPLSDPRRPENRAITGAAVPWHIALDDHWEFHEVRETPDLAAIVQEIVVRSDWSAGNALALIIRNAGPAVGTWHHRRVFAIERGEVGEVARLVMQVTPAIPIVLDVRPSGPQSRVNCRSNGVLPVAVLTTADFNAATVDPRSLALGGEPPVPEAHGRGHLEDVNGDGLPDLMCHFDVQSLLASLSLGSTGNSQEAEALGDIRRRGPRVGTQSHEELSVEVCLTGVTRDGVNIRGCTAIEVATLHTSCGAVVERSLAGDDPDGQMFGTDERLRNHSGSPAPRLLSLAGPFPNPAAGPVEFEVGLPVSGHAHLAVFDVTGREVAIVTAGPRSAGWTPVTWGGLDASGCPVPSGVYMVKLSAPGASLIRRLLVIR